MGSCPGITFSDMWVIDCSVPKHEMKWKQVTQKALNQNGAIPTARGGHSATVLPNGWMYIYGGNTIDQCYNELWRADLKALHEWKSNASRISGTSIEVEIMWEHIKCTRDEADGVYPPAIIGHTSTLVGNDLVIYGGRNLIKREFNNAIYIFNTVLSRWRKIKYGTSIENRTGHTSIPCSSGIIVFGGFTPKGISREIFLLNMFGIKDSIVHAQHSANNSPTCISKKNLKNERKRHSSALKRAASSLDLVASTILSAFSFRGSFIRRRSHNQDLRITSLDSAPLLIEELVETSTDSAQNDLNQYSVSVQNATA